MKKQTFLKALKEGKLYASTKYSQSGLSRKIQFFMVIPESSTIINCSYLIRLALCTPYDKFLASAIDNLIDSYPKNDLYKPLFVKGSGFDGVNDILNSLSRKGFEVDYNYNTLPVC